LRNKIDSISLKKWHEVCNTCLSKIEKPTYVLCGIFDEYQKERYEKYQFIMVCLDIVYVVIKSLKNASQTGSSETFVDMVILSIPCLKSMIISLI
jgi:hypothetical protein